MGRFIDATRGLEWVRLDTAWPRNPKVLELAHRKQWRALVTYIAGLAYSGEHGLDGFIPPHALAFLHGSAGDAATLVAVGLWRTMPDCDGWEVNDWHDYQPTADAMEKRREKARLAARSRWSKHKQNGSK